MSDGTTRPDLAELRRLLEAATGTRWSSEGAHVFVDEAYRWSYGPQTIASCVSYADAKLIVALRNAAEWLIRAAEERDALRDLLARSFFVLQGMEVVWNHEQDCDRFPVTMQRYADEASRLESVIEPVLNRLGVTTVFSFDESPREAPKAGDAVRGDAEEL